MLSPIHATRIKLALLLLYTVFSRIIANILRVTSRTQMYAATFFAFMLILSLIKQRVVELYYSLI